MVPSEGCAERPPARVALGLRAHLPHCPGVWSLGWGMQSRRHWTFKQEQDKEPPAWPPGDGAKGVSGPGLGLHTVGGESVSSPKSVESSMDILDLRDTRQG